MMIGKQSLSSIERSRKVFKDIIQPLSRDGKVSLLPFAPGTSNDSFFTKPERSILTQQQMEAVDTHGLFAALDVYWKEQGNEALISLIKEMDAIAKAVDKEAKANNPDTDSPSELIYQMF